MAEGSPPAAPRGRRYLWILVPVLAWGGILAGALLPFSPPSLSSGAWGCVLASIAIAGLALTKRRKDIVSLFVPLFAVFIFILPPETPQGPATQFLIQILYATTLTALVIRLDKRFS